MSRSLVFNFSGYSGFDMLLALLPKSWQVKSIAKAFLKMHTPAGGSPPNLKKTLVLLVMPFGRYRVVDQKGNVESYSGELTQGM
jgi:hypothetical protein